MNLQALFDFLHQHDNVVVMAHTSPDGDAMGSTAAMGFLLQHLGKKFALYNVDGQPEWLNWMTLPSPVIKQLAHVPFQPQLFICLDSGSANRLGEEAEAALKSGIPCLNIDHHPDNPSYGSLNWVDASMCATGLMVGLLAKAAQLALQGPLAQALYLAMATDTGSFSYGNTTPAALHLTAELVEQGLDIATLRSRMDNVWSVERLRFWGQLMQDVRVCSENQLAACLVSRSLLDTWNLGDEACEGIVEQLRRIKGVRVAMMARETLKNGKNSVKVSLRSSGQDNVQQVAAAFGGGGHRNAAGYTLDLPLAQVLPEILPLVEGKILAFPFQD